MDFKPYKITIEEYQARSLSATQEQVKLKASQEYGRWEKRQTRLRFWSAWISQISPVEVFVMIATVELMIGVCYTRSALMVRLKVVHSDFKVDGAAGSDNPC